MNLSYYFDLSCNEKVYKKIVPKSNDFMERSHDVLIDENVFRVLFISPEKVANFRP